MHADHQAARLVANHPSRAPCDQLHLLRILCCPTSCSTASCLLDCELTSLKIYTPLSAEHPHLRGARGRASDTSVACSAGHRAGSAIVGHHRRITRHKRARLAHLLKPSSRSPCRVCPGRSLTRRNRGLYDRQPGWHQSSPVGQSRCLLHGHPPPSQCLGAGSRAHPSRPDGAHGGETATMQPSAWEERGKNKKRHSK